MYLFVFHFLSTVDYIFVFLNFNISSSLRLDNSFENQKWFELKWPFPLLDFLYLHLSHPNRAWCPKLRINGDWKPNNCTLRPGEVDGKSLQLDNSFKNQKWFEWKWPFPLLDFLHLHLFDPNRTWYPKLRMNGDWKSNNCILRPGEADGNRNKKQ